MCRAGGRRCPNAGGRSTQNTRQAVSRARRALQAAKTSGDAAAVDTARDRLDAARKAHQEAKNAMNHQDHGQDHQTAPTSSADHNGDVTPTAASDTTEPAPARDDPRLTPDQRDAVMRFGWSRAVADSRRMERELAALGLFDIDSGWFTDQGRDLFTRMSSGDWVTDLTASTADQETDTGTTHHHPAASQERDVTDDPPQDPLRRGGIGHITATTVTHVDHPTGPVNLGSGHIHTARDVTFGPDITFHFGPQGTTTTSPADRRTAEGHGDVTDDLAGGVTSVHGENVATTHVWTDGSVVNVVHGRVRGIQTGRVHGGVTLDGDGIHIS